MTVEQFQALSPLLILSAGAALVMLQVAFVRGVALTTGLTSLVLGAAAVSCLFATAPLQVTPLLLVDSLGLLFCLLFTAAAAATVLLSREYMQHHGDEPEEYFLLILLATLGACVLAFAVHLASLLLGLELLSISLYALIAYPNKSVLPLEAAIKYLVLSGAASATALFGFALLYAATGSLEFAVIGEQLQDANVSKILLLAAMAMVVTGLGLKLSLVPFHLWTADVYQGAPAPVTGFLASVAKAAIVVVLLRLFLLADLFRYEILTSILATMAILGMLWGNLAALLQTNLKRMLAFSSVAHLGYLLLIFPVAAVVANRALAVEAAVYYLIAYTATTIAAFGLLTLISADQDEQETVQLQDISGLLWRRPMLAGLMLVAMLSLAGIPLTAGFIAKFYLFSAAVIAEQWLLLTALIVGSGIGIYYYLRVVYYMTRRPEDQQLDDRQPTHWHGQVLSWILILGILILGTVPQPLLAYLQFILRNYNLEL